MTTASIVIYKTPKDDLDRVVECALGDGVECLYIIDHSPAEHPAPLLPADSRIIYKRHENSGYGAGHNVAIRLAMERGARYHAVLNPDIYWDHPLIAPLREYMEGDPRVGMTTPKVYYPNGRLQYTCKLIPTPIDLIGRRFFPAWFMRGRMRRFTLADTGYRREMNVPYMHGCFFLLRVDALRDVGLFDERFFMYPEDIDLTRRIHGRWKTMFVPQCRMYHVHAAESRKSKRMLRVHIVNMIRYFNKWGWFFDPLRRRYNRRLLRSLGFR